MASGPAPVRAINQSHSSPKRRTTVRNAAFSHALSAGIDQANLVRLARPVDAHEPLDLFCHDQFLASCIRTNRDDRQSLYWRSKRNLPQDFRRGQPAGVQVLSRCSRHREGRATPDRRPGPASLKADRFTTALRYRAGWGGPMRPFAALPTHPPRRCRAWALPLPLKGGEGAITTDWGKRCRERLRWA